MNGWISERSLRSCCWRSGRSARTSSAELNRSTVVPWPAAKRNDRDPGHVDGVGCRPVGERRLGELGQHVVARVPPPVLDVVDEPLLGDADVLTAGALDVADELGRSVEAAVVALGHAEQVGDRQHRERGAEGGDELAPATVDEGVERAVGEPPRGTPRSPSAASA